MADRWSDLSPVLLTERKCWRVAWDEETGTYRCLDCGAVGFDSLTDFERHEREMRTDRSGTGARPGRTRFRTVGII